MAICNHPPFPSHVESMDFRCPTPCFVRLVCPDMTDHRWRKVLFRPSGWRCFFCPWNHPDLRLLQLHVDIQHPIEKQRFPRLCVQCGTFVHYTFPDVEYFPHCYLRTAFLLKFSSIRKSYMYMIPGMNFISLRFHRS
jgi:hypothetical protein